MITTPEPDTQIINEPNITVIEFKSAAGSIVTAANVGTGSGVFRDKIGNTLNFRSLNSSDSKLTIVQNADDITFAVIEGQINHDSLLNYVSNQHIDHSTVTITGQKGVSGGGDLTSNRLLELDINTVPTKSEALLSTDEFAVYNVSQALTEKFLISDIIALVPASGEINLGANVGSGADVFKDKTGVTLNFRGINGSTAINAVVNVDNIDVSLADTAVVAASYTNADITVDAQGRITSAANGVSASPGGADTEIQFNDSGSFGANSDFTWTSNLLTVNGRINLNTTTDNTFITGGVDAAGGSGNTGMGALCLDSLQAGSSNTGYGIAALSAVNSGDSNVGIGGSALAAVNSGDRNTAIGTTCLWLNTGSNNTAIGYDAGAISTGSDSVYVGYQAGRNASGSGLLYISNSSTSNPLIYGEFSNDLVRINEILDVTAKIQIATFDALRTSDGDIAGSQSLFVGRTGNTTSTGLGCIAIGHNSMTSNTSGTDNISIGPFSMFINQTGTSNSAFGRSSLEQNVAGSSNSAFGHETLKAIIASSFNTGIGARAMRLKTSGLFNTAIGANSFESNLSGSGNVGVGYQAGRDETGSNKLYIANSSTTTPLIYGEFDNAIVTINGDLSFTGILNMPVLSSNPTTVNGDVWLVETGGQTFLRAQTSGGVKGVQLT